LYKEGFITVIETKVIIHFEIPKGDFRIYLPNLSILNLPNCRSHAPEAIKTISRMEPKIPNVFTVHIP